MRPSQLAGPASSRPSPPPSSVVFVPTEGGECGRRARAPPRHATSLPACLPSPPRLGVPGRRHASSLLSLTLPQLSLALSLARPNTTVAAVRLSHRLRPPLAPPTSSGAPPRLPLPPHRSTSPRKPCIAATSPFPSSGSDHRRRRIRRLQRVPEPVSTPTATAVSYATVSPFFPALSRPLGPSPTAAESFTPPAMSPSWPRSP